MRSLSCVLRLAVLSSLYVTLAPSGAWATASGVCDGVHVKQRGKSLTVSPTGTDDTANLQCALHRGTAAGPGATLNLTSGSFHTAQLIASNFQGTLRGNGINSTILQNLPNLPVANRFTGASGPRVELTFGDDVGCWLVLNDTSAVTGIGTYLGPGTKGGVVITQDPGSVVDDGTGSLVISRRR